MITGSAGKDAALLRVIRNCGIEEEAIVSFREQLQGAAPRSIDRFLELNQEHRPAGRAFIAALLMQREHTANLLDSGNEERWYGYLWDLIEADAPESLFTDDRLSVITFNYDRSLEYWLIKKISHYYGIPRSLAIAITRRLKIVHVHGRLGGIEEQESKARPYEPDVNEHALHVAMGDMRLIGDASEDDAGFKQAHEQLLRANLICFLGIGYHPTNIKRLKLQELCSNRLSGKEWEVLAMLGVPGNAALRGTALGLTDSEKQRTIGTAFGTLPITVSNESVLRFLRNNAEYFHWG